MALQHRVRVRGRGFGCILSCTHALSVTQKRPCRMRLVALYVFAFKLSVFICQAFLFAAASMILNALRALYTLKRFISFFLLSFRKPIFMRFILYVSPDHSVHAVGWVL